MESYSKQDPGFEEPGKNALAEDWEPEQMEEAAIPYPGEEQGGDMPKSKIERVVQQHEKRLLSIDRVVGVGVQTNEKGDNVIVVYLRDETAEKQIPSKLDGFPVKTQISGEFDAY